MANIVNPPARINRNTAADGDFLWKQDFEVLYNNDVALEQAIQQASQDYTAGDGISIDPSTKTISVKTGTGIEKTEEGLSVNIEGVDGAKVELNGNTYKVSAYNAEPAIEGLNNNLEDLQNELTSFENEVKEKYITSGNEMVPNHQYVYTTSGWADIGGEHATVSYWRPTYNESTGKLSWQMSPSIEAPADALVKGEQGDNGQTPEFRINQSTNFWEWKYTDESQSSWRSTNTSATGSRGAQGEQGIQGYTPEITHAVDTDNSGVKVTISWPAESEIPSTDFTIPSGTPGVSGRNGIDGASGKTPKLQINSTTNYWEVSYDDGGTWTSLNVEATGPAGADGFNPVVTTSTIAPDPQDPDHKNGGTKVIISNRSGTPAEANIWNGNNGTAVVQAEGYVTGNGTSQNPVKLKTEAVDAIEAVSGKTPLPPNNYQDRYGIWDNTNKVWVDPFDYFTQILTKDIPSPVAGTKYVMNNSLEWEPLNTEYLPLAGGTLTGPLVVSASNHNIVGLGKGAFQFGQTRYNSNDQVIGTNWMGVVNGSYTGGFLKYVDGGTSASEEGANGKVQINYSVDNGRGKIEVNASVPNGLESSTQVINATTASVNGMATSAIDSNNMSGPNYMIAKNANGQFVIGAAVYNCQGNLPGTLTPNTYYFVY